jgi:hypothetical protein
MTDIWRSIGHGFGVILAMGLVGLWPSSGRSSPLPDSRPCRYDQAPRHGDLTSMASVDTNDEIGT